MPLLLCASSGFVLVQLRVEDGSGNAFRRSADSNDSPEPIQRDQLWTVVPYFGMLTPRDTPAEWVNVCSPILLFLCVSVPEAGPVTLSDTSP